MDSADESVSGGDLSYTKPYLSAVQSALHSSKPLESTLELFRHPLYKRAHPTPEHLLPLVVAVAAAQEGGEGTKVSDAEDLYVGMDGNLGRERDAGLGWGMWRWK
jgi:4,5-DOPA dioxygenase extradiol